MKKIISLMMISVLCVGLMIGCGNKSTSKQTEATQTETSQTDIAAEIDEPIETTTESVRLKYKEYGYEKCDGGVKIVSYDHGMQNDDYVIDIIDIPSEINGYSVVELDKNAFLICPVKEVKIPGSVKIIGIGCFEDCVKLEKVSIGDGVETIETRAFYGCENLTDINIPSSVKDVGYRAFIDDVNLKNINFKGNVYELKDEVFKNTGIETFVVPSSVRIISPWAFGECEALKEITIPRSVVDISQWAFDDSPNVIIKGYKDTYAETFANDHNLPFVEIQ